jgi:hypothetical protein
MCQSQKVWRQPRFRSGAWHVADIAGKRMSAFSNGAYPGRIKMRADNKALRRLHDMMPLEYIGTLFADLGRYALNRSSARFLTRRVRTQNYTLNLHQPRSHTVQHTGSFTRDTLFRSANAIIDSHRTLSLDGNLEKR